MRPLPRTRRAGRFNLAKSARSLSLFGPDLAALTAAVLPCEYQQKSAYVRIGFPEFGKRAAWSFAKLLRRSGRHRESGTTIAILVASDGFLASLGTSRLARSPFLALLALAVITIGQFMWAQNLGSAPASNVAVQGQTGAQPEGAFLNFINWVGNVIAPVGAGGAVLGAVVSWLTGRGFGRWLFAAAALLAISGVTRLIEFWVTNGTGGVT